MEKVLQSICVRRTLRLHTCRNLMNRKMNGLPYFRINHLMRNDCHFSLQQCNKMSFATTLHYCRYSVINTVYSYFNCASYSPIVFSARQKCYYSAVSTPDSGKNGIKSNNVEENTSVISTDNSDKQLSVFQRFKKAYKEHGKVLVAVHIATSIVWYSSFYLAARNGVNIVPLLEKWGFNDTLINQFKAGGLGDFAMAYLLYKLFTPIRYPVTIGGTNLAIRYLRHRGKMAPKSDDVSLKKIYMHSKQHFRNSSLHRHRFRRSHNGIMKQKLADVKKVN